MRAYLDTVRRVRRWGRTWTSRASCRRSGGETAPGAFDDAEDFARHDVDYLRFYARALRRC
jgi:hypothetical protein